MPLAPLIVKILFIINGFPVPLTKIPSRPHLVKVLLTIIGLVDSTQIPVPLVWGFVTVTPRI